MRQIVIAAAISCASVSGQSTAATDVFTKAPPQVDEALRERIAGFYQRHVEGKFRAAEHYIAADSLDLFYESDKTKYIGFEIVKIDYTDDFTKAVVVTAIEVDWRTVRLGTIRVKPPMTSTWKIENGKWCWYTIKRTDWDTPWGKMNKGPENPGDTTSAMAAAFKGITPESIQTRVQVNKGIATLNGFEKSQDTIEVSNGLNGEIRLRVDAVSMPGLTVVADKTVLKAGEVARISFKYDPPVKGAKPSVAASIHIEPTGETVGLQVIFELPKAMQQELDRAKIK